MAPHVHIGLVEFLSVAAYVIIFTFLWRAAIAALIEKQPNIAGALAAVYS